MCYYYVYIHIAIGFFSKIKNMHKPNIKYQLQEHVHQPIRIYIYTHTHNPLCNRGYSIYHCFFDPFTKSNPPPNGLWQTFT